MLIKLKISQNVLLNFPDFSRISRFSTIVKINGIEITTLLSQICAKLAGFYKGIGFRNPNNKAFSIRLWTSLSAQKAQKFTHRRISRRSFLFETSTKKSIFLVQPQRENPENWRFHQLFDCAQVKAS